MHYQFEISLTPFEPWSEILTAYLGELNFEGFYEKEDVLYAFISQELYSEIDFKKTLKIFQEKTEVRYDLKELPHQNWNAQWESNFDPVFIENELAIVAPFHKIEKGFKRRILIEPKMSFGTGHHQTTYMMCKAIINDRLEGASILDMGSGTGVLAILCEIEGAKSILAIDIEPWSVENCAQNAIDNKCTKIESLLGDVDLIEGRSFDRIFANINKNILLRQITQYAKSLNPKGFLYLSGFFNSDASDLKESAQKLGLQFQGKTELENWCMLVFKK